MADVVMGVTSEDVGDSKCYKVMIFNTNLVLIWNGYDGAF